MSGADQPAGGVETVGAVLGGSPASGAASRIAVVGCGGKTTWIESLARESARARVLITPTTRMYPPKAEDIALCQTPDACAAHRPRAGIQCLGILEPRSGKLTPLPPEALARIASEYNLALMEADGSRGLPLKGWRADEPVIPSFCDMTVGILTLEALGRPLDEAVALRLPEFMRLTGMRRGEPVTLCALTRMVCAPEGMFRGDRPRCLFVNRVEDARTAARAEAWLLSLKAEHPGRFCALAYGSARENTWRRV